MSRPEPKPGAIARAASYAYTMRRRIATGVAIAVAVVFGFHVIFGRNGLDAYEQKRMEDRNLQQQIQSLQQENIRVQQHVQQLKTDPDAIEHEARERLHYARPGEVIYTLDDKAAAQGAGSDHSK